MSELLLITKPEHDLFPTLSLHGSLITEVSPLSNRPLVLVHTNSCSTLLPAHQVNKWLWPSLQMDDLYEDFWLRTLALGPWGVIKWSWSLHTVTRTPCRWQLMTAKQTNKWAHCSKISTCECTSAQMADHFRSNWSAGAQKGYKETCGLLFWCFQDHFRKAVVKMCPNEHMGLTWGPRKKSGEHNDCTATMGSWDLLFTRFLLLLTARGVGGVINLKTHLKKECALRKKLFENYRHASTDLQQFAFYFF